MKNDPKKMKQEEEQNQRPVYGANNFHNDGSFLDTFFEMKGMKRKFLR